MVADDDADDLGGFGRPLPPDDRLWRHPSELAAHHGGGPSAASAPASPRSGWGALAAAGLAGAVAATGLMAVTGSLADGGGLEERRVVERVALDPVVSAPTARGDLGVVRLTNQVRPSVAGLDVELVDGARSGSAVLYRDDGHLLTSAALLEGASTVTAILEGRRYPARIVGTDPLTDVAVVRVEATSGLTLVGAVLGNGEALELGQPAVSIGVRNPGRSPLVATGVVSALGLRVDRNGADPLHGMIQIDVPIAEAAVGGPVLDSRGAVIGIASGAVEPTGRFGFAVPIDLARRVADDLVVRGVVKHCWLGIEGVDLDPIPAGARAPTGGTLVLAVSPSSPAEAVGLRTGDVITDLDGVLVDGISPLVAALRLHYPGDVVTLGLWRDGRRIERKVTLGATP